MIIFLLIFLAVFMMTIVSGVYVFVAACVRKKELPWLVESELNKTSYSKYSKHIQAADRWLKEHNAQDVYFTSDDGLKLHGYWIPAENPRGTIILAHGYRSSPLLDFGFAFSHYHSNRMNILLPDQRAHGKSQGRIITFGVKESKDMRAWVAFHNQHFKPLPILLSGLSMGASTMLFLADKDIGENVKGIIADCGFTSPHAILSCVFRRVTHLWPVPSILVTEICARLFGGFSLWECDTRKCLSATRVPVMLVHGKADDFVPHEMTQQAYDACTGPKKILLVDGAEHGVSFLVEQEKYTQLINAFLDENIFRGE